MKLSQGVEWGVHCAVVLARAPSGTAISRRSLARHFGLPEAYLAKHLQAMVRGGVLTATPGPKGGFRLARSPEAITVLEVVEAVEGDAAPFTCTEIRQQGTGGLPAKDCTRPCAVNMIMSGAHEAWRVSLAGTTVADIRARLPKAAQGPFTG